MTVQFRTIEPSCLTPSDRPLQTEPNCEIFKRQTWNKPLAEIKDDEHAVIKKLAKNQHAWAFPDFIARGGAMQYEEIFQCWKVRLYTLGIVR